ncbi:hypothetical protein BKA93DRAFT_798933 [Sparassis latifolia]
MTAGCLRAPARVARDARCRMAQFPIFPPPLGRPIHGHPVAFSQIVLLKDMVKDVHRGICHSVREIL